MVSSTTTGPIILVTGANKGLGLEVVHRLATKKPDATILLGSRSVDNAKTAIEQLQKRDSGKKLAKVEPLQIDVTDQKSIDNAKHYIEQQYGKLNILINNSGIASQEKTKEAAKQTLDVNYYGAKHTIETLLPLIPQDGTGHIVIVSSEVGAWSHHETPKGGKVRDQIDHPEKLSTADLDKIVEQYLQIADDPEQLSKRDYATPDKSYGSYGSSKTFVSTYARILARELKAKKIPVVLVCPGYCATDLNHNSGPRPAWLGAKSIVYGTTVGIEQTGNFYQDAKELPYNYAMPDIEEYKRKSKEQQPEEDRKEKEGVDAY